MTDPNNLSPKVNRSLKKVVEAKEEARKATAAAEHRAMVALHDRNTIAAALLAERRGDPIMIPQSTVDAASQRAHLVAYDRTEAVLAQAAPRAVRWWQRWLRRLSGLEQVAVPVLAPGDPAKPVPVPVLVIRWATQAEAEKVEQELKEAAARQADTPPPPPPEEAKADA